MFTCKKLGNCPDNTVCTRDGDPSPDVSRVVSPAAICPECGPVRAVQSWKRLDRRPWGKYRAQYVYRCPNAACRNGVVEPHFRPASEVIDWTLTGIRIGDRQRPLAAKTMERIQAGIDRYWKPMLVPAEGRPGKVALPVDLPARTITTRNETALLVPTGGTWRRDAVPTTEPAPTRTTRENDGIAFPAFIAEMRGGGSDARLVEDPLATTASGNHHGLVTTALISSYYGNGDTRPADQPLSTVTTLERHALLMRNNTARGDQGQMTTPVSEYARTITTSGHQSLLASPAPTVDVTTCGFGCWSPERSPRRWTSRPPTRCSATGASKCAWRGTRSPHRLLGTSSPSSSSPCSANRSLPPNQATRGPGAPRRPAGLTTDKEIPVSEPAECPHPLSHRDGGRCRACGRPVGASAVYSPAHRAALAAHPGGCPLDFCPVCGRRIVDFDMTGYEHTDGQRWCTAHHADWKKPHQ